MQSQSVLLVAVGGAIGSVVRFLAVEELEQRWPIGFPLGTLLVNISGSFLIGFIAGSTNSKEWQQFLMTGIMGGYTTFSSFSLQTLQLTQKDQWGRAGLYIGLSMVCCILGAWAGQQVARLCSPHTAP